MADITGEEPMHDGDKQRTDIIRDMFDARISTEAAAEFMASLSLETWNEGGLGLTWSNIVIAAQRSTDINQLKLVELLYHMARLPAPMDEHGKQLMVYDMRVWGQLSH